MLDNLELYLRSIREMNVEYASFHIGVVKHPLRLIREIKTGGTNAGIALNPCTGIENLSCLLGEVDYVLLMTVEPGFLGQGFVSGVLEKITALRKLMEAHKVDFPIEVDGNISLETARWCTRKGASILVAGTSSIFKTDKDSYPTSLEFKRGIATWIRRCSVALLSKDGLRRVDLQEAAEVEILLGIRSNRVHIV
jgi:ribulose-phosphate 3-epimerase